MKNKIFQYAGWAVTLLVVFLLLRQCIQQRATEKRLQRIVAASIPSTNTKIEYKYLHDSIEHTVIKEVIVKSDIDKKLAVGNTYIDSVSQALNIAVKKISELTKVNTNLQTRVKLLSGSEGVGDKQRTIKVYKDKYLDAKYYPDNDSLELNHDVNLQIVKYSKRKNFLSPYHQYIDFYSDDPRVSINRVKRFSTDITPKPKRFGIGPFVGATYNGKWEATYGVGISYQLIRF